MYCAQSPETEYACLYCNLHVPSLSLTRMHLYIYTCPFLLVAILLNAVNRGGRHGFRQTEAPPAEVKKPTTRRRNRRSPAGHSRGRPPPSLADPIRCNAAGPIQRTPAPWPYIYEPVPATLSTTFHSHQMVPAADTDGHKQEQEPTAAVAGDLIPGLPDDLARECLERVAFEQLPAARRVSRGWKAEVESPAHHRFRRRRTLLALTQARPPLAGSGPARKYAADGYSFRLVLHDPAAGAWTPLPPLPGAGGLPLFCQLAAVGEGPAAKLLVLGGWDPETWAPTPAVHAYDFLTGAWRRGADMPGPPRSFFACAAVGGRVFVAGGHDAEKNALRSAAAYDAAADAWTALPEMARERDEPRGVRVAGRFFLVVGGYPTDAQGRFAGSAEAFDPATWSWGPVQERVIEDGACPRTCCAADDDAGSGRMYMVHDGCVLARDAGGGAWRTLARVPEDGRAAKAVVAVGDGRVVVLGAEQDVHVLSHGGATAAPSWTRAAAPPEFAGNVQAACCVHI
ncbi:hypothetical protein BS78_04G081900 [Paspalum vaginatum]|nr:hypothetical protein BS78_04G081900 [Paspalum vaginatum]